MNAIHIVTAISDEYCRHLAVMLRSLFENKKLEYPVHLYILNSGLSDRVMNALNDSMQEYPLKLHYVLVDRTLYQGLIEQKHISLEAYFRIHVPELLDESLEKVIYMDPDTIIKEDLYELWSTDISDYYLGAVEWAFGDDRMNILSIPEQYGYFNAGVLLINLEKWRKENIAQRLWDFLNHNPEKIRHMDQDALNAVLYHGRLHLDPKWNYTTGHLLLLRLDISPAIIHFSGPRKPWTQGHPLEDEYFGYLKKLRWDYDLLFGIKSPSPVQS
ncbi:glycosyltransferase family 8 protein [Paenibacillus sp. HB172176]|uniref:glycosyltransferase family 8 protein n=1 Tax=Paenibacillus sp. HB172176 TaxID=2493690 RepID=UPI00143C40C1|nr:glycosyltransferase family 8 protein [Paenibacillus sp. HB172176]